MDDDTQVYWERRFNIKDCTVADLGAESPRSLYVSWRDWGFKMPNSSATSPPLQPLANLAYMVFQGATVLDTPRVPEKDVQPMRVILEQGAPTEAPTLSSLSEEGEDEATAASNTLRQQLLERIPAHLGDTKLANDFVNGMLRRRKVFTPVDPKETTLTVDFVLIGEPTTVAFRVPTNRRVPSEAMQSKFGDWFAREIAEKVPWSTPSYGYAHIVPQPGGKFRVVINPVGLNKAIQSVDTPYLPKNMIRAAQEAGRSKVGASLDLSEAFTTLKLSDTAKTYSTFVTQLGKIRFNNAYFGVKTFPAQFQTALYENVVLPTMDDVLGSIILSWIDDVLIGATSNEHLLEILFKFVDRLLNIGGRLSLNKCNFFITLLHWCGVEVDLVKNQWRVDPARVESLRNTPKPEDQTGLSHILGTLRYYYWTVPADKQLQQRQLLATLAELDKPRLDLLKAWTPEHTEAMRLAFNNICDGDWLLVYDPRQPVYVTTDASGLYGFAVCANQYDTHTGVMQPIANFSQGWLGTQLRGWTPQVKEAYAVRYAVTKIMPASFPFANVIVLCDNRNLSSLHDSEDLRIQRWQQEISDAGAITRQWVPGDYNTIADHASRTVYANPTSSPTEEDIFHSYIYSISSEKGEETAINHDAPNTVVPGHLPIAAMTATIGEAQQRVSDTEKDEWSSRPHYSTVTLAGRTLHLHERRLIVPAGAVGIKTKLLDLAHDDRCHYTGAERTLKNLQDQAKVWWINIGDEVLTYIKSCFKCAFAKSRHTPNRTVGSLTPTIPPYVNHTWYCDLKGPMPEGTGYLLAVVEGLCKEIRLRYIPAGTAEQVVEELLEVVASFGTTPIVIRSDGGPPFNSTYYNNWCASENILPVLGVADHSQGQGTVETKFNGIATSLMAVLGGKAPAGWYKTLTRSANSSASSTLHTTPHWAAHQPGPAPDENPDRRCRHSMSTSPQSTTASNCSALTPSRKTTCRRS